MDAGMLIQQSLVIGESYLGSSGGFFSFQQLL
jgi:hypothetical protein